MDVRIPLIFAGAAATLWAVLHWREALQVVMVLLVAEGAIRKWAFPGAQDLVYLGKDVILVGAYLGFLRQLPRLRHRSPPVPLLNTVLLLGAIFCLFEIFNPLLPNLLVGAFGFKAYYLYVPLVFVLPAAFHTDRELMTALRRYILLAIPVGILGAAQFLSPSSSLLNTYARSEGAEGGYVSTFGSSEFVRVTASFSYITGYASYLVAITILLLAYLAATRWRLRHNVPIYLALGMSLLGMLMTGSRGPVLLLALLFPLYWWLAVMREQSGSTFWRILIGLALLGALLGSVGGDAVGAFRGRASAGGNISDRLLAPFTSPFEVLPDAGPFGYGIGATHQTARALTPGIVPYSWLHGIELEAESGRVMLELGPVGFLFVYFVRVYLVLFAFRQVLVLRTSFHRAVATASLLFFLAQLPGNIVFDVTADLFYWFFAGLLLLVMRLDREAVARALRLASASAAPTRIAPRPRATLVPAAPAAPAVPAAAGGLAR